MFSNMKLGYRLGLGFGLVLLLMILVSAFALRQMNALSGLTRQMYEHPFVVSNTILQIDGDIVRIHRAMKDVALAQSKTGMDLPLQKVNELEERVLYDFKIIKTHFLGDKSMVEQAEKIFRDWQASSVRANPLKTASPFHYGPQIRT